MAVLETTLIVEDRIKELVGLLPAMKDEFNVNNLKEYNVTLKVGDEKELNSFLKIENNDPYPLIWLLQPYSEEHLKSKVVINNFSLVLAVNSNASYTTEQRLDTTYKKILIPLFNNVKHLFRNANIINVERNEYTVIKFPNYSGDTNDGDGHIAGDIWDALKITFNCDINKHCLKPVIF